MHGEKSCGEVPEEAGEAPDQPELQEEEVQSTQGLNALTEGAVVTMAKQKLLVEKLQSLGCESM